MPVNSLGYRAWEGKRSLFWMPTYVIAKTGIQRSWQNRWLRKLMFFAWMPALWFAVGFFIYEKALEFPDFSRNLMPFLRSSLGNARLDTVFAQIEAGDLESARHSVWSFLLLTFFRNPQGVLMALVVGLIAPPLISQDIRSRAYLLYFSRPIGRLEYILGKLATVWFYLFMISMAPALALYAMGVLLSPDVGVVAKTWDLPFRIILSTMILSVPTASLALCISSLTQESRVAGFAWFTILILGWVTFGVLSTVEGINQTANGFAPSPFNGGSNWSLLSLYHTLGRVQSWAFGFFEFREVTGSAIVLVLVTVISLAILMRRVVAPMRAS